jgi:hypothetical protein
MAKVAASSKLRATACSEEVFDDNDDDDDDDDDDDEDDEDEDAE